MAELADLKKLPDLSDEERRKVLRITEPAEILHAWAHTCRDKGQLHTAAVAAKRALAICPDSGYLWTTLSAIHWDAGDFFEARAAGEKAAKLWPTDAAPFFNLAQAYGSTGMWPEAFRAFNKTFSFTPDDHGARWNYAMAHLDAGSWNIGFELYDVRIVFRGDAVYPRLNHPTWDGSDINGKTIYVNAEQGVGDRILFSRYLWWLHEAYPDCKIKCLMSSPDLPPLEPLLWRYSDFVEFLFNGVEVPKADYAVYLMSLPKYHGTMPNNIPPDPGLILKRCRPFKDLAPTYVSRVPSVNVGICWTGNPGMARNSDRTIPLKGLLEFAENPHIQLYSLQFPPGKHELQKLMAAEIIKDLYPDMANWGLLGQAGCAQTMDLVITACTSTAHLCGALGIPTWVLLCYDHYWVWGRKDFCGWYPSVRLFRQDVPGDWQEVLDRVRVALNQFAAEMMESDEWLTRQSSPGPAGASSRRGCDPSGPSPSTSAGETLPIPFLKTQT